MFKFREFLLAGMLGKIWPNPALRTATPLLEHCAHCPDRLLAAWPTRRRPHSRLAHLRAISKLQALDCRPIIRPWCQTCALARAATTCSTPMTSPPSLRKAPSLLQVVLQVGIGVGLAGLYYYSLYKPANQPSLLGEVVGQEKAPHDTSSSSAAQLQALEAETRKTTAQLWGLEQPSGKPAGSGSS